MDGKALGIFRWHRCGAAVIIWLLLAAWMCAASALTASAEPQALAGRLCRAFAYDEDGADAMIQFYIIDGELIAEQAGMAYWAAVVSPDEPEALSLESEGEARLTGTARRFSGFSQAGKFWDGGRRAEIALSADGTLTFRVGAEEPIVAVPCPAGVSIHYPEHLAEQLPAGAGGAAAAGEWESEDGSVTASLRADGMATVISRGAGEPPVILFGVWGQSGHETDGPQTMTIDMIAKRVGWGGQPTEAQGELPAGGGSLILRGLPRPGGDGEVTLRKLR